MDRGSPPLSWTRVDLGLKVGRVSTDRGRRWPWEVNPDRPSLDASERGDHLRREALAQEGHRSLVGEGLDDRVDRVGTALALGDEPAEWALIGLRASRRTALEVGEQPLGDRGGLGSSATATSITPLAVCMSSGPIPSGSTRPSPPPSIMAGPPMPKETYRSDTAGP